MPTPSLLIVPSRWKAGSPGKLYSQIPTNGNGDFNVTGVVTGGTSIGTRVNNIGYIEPITTSGTPRLDYYTSSGVPGCPALLVEPSAQNLALQSENFLTTWSNTSLVITSGFTSPSNNSNGTLIEASANTGRLRQTFAAITSGTTHTFSLFAEAGNLALASGVSLVFQEGTGTNFVSGVVQSFRLDTGTLGASGTLGAGFTLTRASIEDYGNGWYRCSMTVTVSYTPASANISIRPTSTIVSNLPSTVIGGSAYIYGAQLETGSVATSYIPTTTTAVTRSADVISATGAVSGSIGQTEGTIYVEVDVRNAISRVASILQLRQDGNNQITLGITTAFGGTNTIAARAQQAGSFVVGFFQSNNATGIYKIAFAYKSTDCKLYINGTDSGVTISLNNAFTAFSFNEIQLGMSNSLNQFNDRIRAAALYTTRLTNADLMLLTMPGNNTYLPQAIWDNYLSRPGNSEVPDCLYTRHADLLDV